MRFHRFWDREAFWQYFWRIHAGRESGKTAEASYPGFPHMNGRMIEFSREGCQVQVFDIHYGHKLTGAGKGPELAQAYLKGLEGTGERRAWSEGQRTKVLG
jgi:hypothetical protein